MKNLGIAVLAGIALAGCGDKAKPADNPLSAIAQVANAATSMTNAQQEAEKFAKERQEKGDTIALPYTELQKFLPPAPDGYTANGEPGGSSQSMGAFSMSQAEQKYTVGTDGNGPAIQVTIIDFGGTQAGYGMLAAPMMMRYSMEDAHSRIKSLTMGVPYTWGSEEFNKDDKTAKVSAITRYRYVITVEGRNQSEDNSSAFKRMAEEIAKKFDGK
jgi:hypothetical protein